MCLIRDESALVTVKVKTELFVLVYRGKRLVVHVSATEVRAHLYCCGEAVGLELVDGLALEVLACLGIKVQYRRADRGVLVFGMPGCVCAQTGILQCCCAEQSRVQINPVEHDNAAVCGVGEFFGARQCCVGPAAVVPATAKN